MVAAEQGQDGSGGGVVELDQKRVKLIQMGGGKCFGISGGHATAIPRPRPGLKPGLRN